MIKAFANQGLPQKKLFENPWWRQLFTVALIDISVKACCAIIAFIIVINLGKTTQTTRIPPTIIGSIVLAPMLESFALAASFEALSVMGIAARFSITSVVALAGLLHGIDRGWLAFVSVSFLLFLYSALYSTYRKESVLSGVISSAMPHAISNTMFFAVWLIA